MSKNNNRIKIPLPRKTPKKKDDDSSLFRHLVNAFLIFFLLVGVYGMVKENKAVKNISLTELVSEIQKGEIKEVEISGEKLTAKKNDETVLVSKKEMGSSFSETLKNYGVEPAKISAVNVKITTDTGAAFWLSLLPIFLPIIFVILIIWWLSRQAKGGGMQAFSFGQSKAKMIDPNDPNQKVTFDDVAGNKEAKIELGEIVDFLKNPKKFLDIGAKIPKGVLLFGHPGTGKTLLARAVAGEAKVAFFHLSGSEFVEMFVGVGASRVRDLFDMAKKNAPSIIFIDEIDAIGRVRGVGLGGGNDEREQTLNQILVEMDGFEPTASVIVMAATNRQDVLDPALLRPGRFDRRVTLDLPDRKDREAILMVHTKKKPLAANTDIKVLAERTPGFSGADLESLMNEAAILAARHERKEILQEDLLASIEKVMLGPERKSHLMTAKEKELTAYHEAGHALVASVLPHADPVHKISIISRGRAGGYTLKLPLEDKKLGSKNEFIDDLAVSLGGYVAEEMILGTVTTGPSNDLQVSSALAREMVTRYGMSDVFGPIAFEKGKGKTMFGEEVDGDISPALAKEIDDEVRRLMKNAYETTKKVLTEKRVVLDAIAKKLIEVENIEQKEYEEILTAHNIPLKK
jgi:cell division protease FtsH